MRTIGVVTTGRADFGIYRPLLKKIMDDPELELYLMVSGMHLSPEFGLTVQEIEKERFPIAEKIECLLSSDTPEGIAKSMGLATVGFAQSFSRRRPDLLVVLGDRFEMFAAALASLPFGIPIAHLYGGESTEGLIDEAIRHSLTKMSHLHFVALDRYRRRVIRMGEEPWRVTVCGALSLDNLDTLPLFSLEKIKDRIQIPEGPAPILITFHPVTLEYQHTRRYMKELLAALESIDLPLLFTFPNADTEGRVIIQAIERFVDSHPRAAAIVHLGTQLYFSLMKVASALVGNSSSGIIEAASFGLPVVNIGNRQRGRFHGPNVLDVPCEQEAIFQGIRRVLSPEFLVGFQSQGNPYGAGRSAEQIVQRLKQIELDDSLTLKRFYEGQAE